MERCHFRRLGHWRECRHPPVLTPGPCRFPFLCFTMSLSRFVAYLSRFLSALCPRVFSISFRDKSCGHGTYLDVSSVSLSLCSLLVSPIGREPLHLGDGRPSERFGRTVSPLHFRKSCDADGLHPPRHAPRLGRVLFFRSVMVRGN